MKKEINGVTLYGEFAEIAENITDFEWELFNFTQDVSDQLHEQMALEGLNKADLARRLGVSKAFITKVLRGNANLNFKTFIKLVNALGGLAHLKILPKNLQGSQVKWFGVFSKINEQNMPKTPLKKMIPLHSTENCYQMSIQKETLSFSDYSSAV